MFNILQLFKGSVLCCALAGQKLYHFRVTILLKKKKTKKQKEKNFSSLFFHISWQQDDKPDNINFKHSSVQKSTEQYRPLQHCRAACNVQIYLKALFFICLYQYSFIMRIVLLFL